MKSVVIGVGNEMNGDDGIGIRVAKQLQQDGLQNSETLVIPADVPENWIQPIVKFRPELLILIDSADFQGKAGEIRAIKDSEISKVFTNTHSVPLVLFLETIKKQVKTKTIFIGIQPKAMGFEKPMSKEVRAAGNKAADVIKKIMSGKVSV